MTRLIEKNSTGRRSCTKRVLIIVERVPINRYKGTVSALQGRSRRKAPRVEGRRQTASARPPSAYNEQHGTLAACTNTRWAQVRPIRRCVLCRARYKAHGIECIQVSHDIACIQVSHDIACIQVSHDIACIQVSHDIACIQASQCTRACCTTLVTLSASCLVSDQGARKRRMTSGTPQCRIPTYGRTWCRIPTYGRTWCRIPTYGRTWCRIPTYGPSESAPERRMTLGKSTSFPSIPA